MKDNALIKIFYPILRNALNEQMLNNVILKQSNQPTLQGVPTNPTIFFFKVSSKRYGYLKRSNSYVQSTNDINHSEKQFYESTWQLSALALQDPSNINLNTASDLVQIASSILQSDKTRRLLKEEDVYILRVMSMNNPYFVDDYENFEASPSFDFTLVYSDIITNKLPEISNINGNLVGV